MNPIYWSLPDAPAWSALRAEAVELLGPSTAATGIRVIVTSAGTGAAAPAGFTLERQAAPDGAVEYRVIAGTPAAAAHGFHHLLRLAGFGFSFFADAPPAEFAPRWPVTGDSYHGIPDFSVRGLLPWHNFLNSPTVWNPEDYQRYLKTIWRWGGNTALFHNYDEEPLAAFPDPVTGQWRAGKRMDTTFDAPWGGVKGIKLDAFGHGTGALFPFNQDGAWGARNAFAADPIAAAQAEFADASAFGASLGLNIVFGFELLGDPSWPGYRDLLAARLRHVLAAYPSLGTLCLWEQEGHGVRGWLDGACSAGLASLEETFGNAFDGLKTSSPARYREGLRLAALFGMAYEIVREIRPNIRIAFAGWGGDRWMRWGDYWPGLHRILPPDAILAQLDNIMPHSADRVASVPAELARERELWSIPWVESDGGGGAHASQWHPQEAVAQQAKLAQSAHALGYQGLLGIHWQTAGCEVNAMHLVQAAGWRAASSMPEFYAAYAQTFFTRSSVAIEVAAILAELEALGPSWTGNGQQTECSLFEWDSMPRLSPEGTIPNALAKLEEPLWAARAAMFATPEVEVRIICHFDNLLFRCATQKLPADALPRLATLRQRFAALGLRTPHARRLLATVDFVLAFEAIKRQLEPRGELARRHALLTQMTTLGLPPDPGWQADYNRRRQTVAALWPALFAAQQARLDTVGDYGNLANLNLKAWQAWHLFAEA